MAAKFAGVVSKAIKAVGNQHFGCRLRLPQCKRVRLLSLTYLCYILLAPAIITSCVKLPRHAAVAGNLRTSELTPGNSVPGATAAKRININTASGEELERLPGIGKGLAARIVEHRERHGAFRRVEHLIIVRGISERRFEELRTFVTTD
jgi:competence ComEA-like helix-hairpin-helix protein